MMETPCNAFLVAEETKGDGSKSVVGCVHCCWSGPQIEDKDGDADAHFGMLSVPKECSGRGIGKLLVSAAGVCVSVCECVEEEQSTRSCASDYHVKRSSTKPPRVTHTSLDVLPSRDRTHLRSRLLCRCSLSRHPIPAVRAEERCRKELRRKDIVVEISVVSFFPELFAWYEAQGYRRKRSIPFPVPELVRDGCAFELQLMTKTIS